jgi:HEAT repeat protein
MCYWSLKEEPFKNKEAEAIYLKSIQEGALKSSKGVLDGEKEFDLDGLKCKDSTCMGPDAKEATEALIQLTKKGNFYARQEAAKALKEIDPSTATKLGID